MSSYFKARQCMSSSGDILTPSFSFYKIHHLGAQDKMDYQPLFNYRFVFTVSNFSVSVPWSCAYSIIQMVAILVSYAWTVQPGESTVYMYHWNPVPISLQLVHWEDLTTGTIATLVLGQIILKFNRTQKIEDLTKSKNFFTYVVEKTSTFI